jgi:DNA-binding XRE family transcriptional regulator
MEMVRMHTFPSQYRENLCQILTQPPAFLETLVSQIAAIATAQYSAQIQTEPSTLNIALEALLQRAFRQYHLWDKISQEVWVNLLTWTVQDLEIPIALSVIQNIAQAPYREDLWHLLISPATDSHNSPAPSTPACVLEILLEKLEPLICQDLMTQILENPQALEPLFLGLPPQQSILEIALPALTLHPCNALVESPPEISDYVPVTPPSPSATPIVLEHYLTRPSELHRLPWELMGQIKQQCGLPMVQLLFLLVGYTMRHPHSFTLTHREILEQLDWGASADQPSSPPDLPYLLKQIDTLTLTTFWMSEPTAAAQVEAISISGHPWEILSKTQGTLDWVTGGISQPAESSITLRPGLWLHHLFEKGGLSAQSAWETFGQLALTLLERDHCRDPFLISLLTVLSLNAPEPQPEVRPSCYTVHTLLDATLPTTVLETLQLHPDIAPTLFKIWYQALESLVTLGWTSRPIAQAQPTDFYIAPFPDWLNIHCHRRKPSDWIAQWLVQPLHFIAPLSAISEPSSARPLPSVATGSRRLSLDRLSGSAIRRARKGKALTQSQLADMLHVHQSLIAKIEVGQRTVTEDLERSLRQVLEL